MNGEIVALTQATPGTDGEEQPVEVMSRSATLTRAWKVVLVRGPVFLKTIL